MRSSILISVFLLAATSTARGQQRPAVKRDTSIAGIMARARRGAIPSETALDILRQRSGVHAQTKRAALADSITALAVANRNEAFRAVQVIARSGSRDRGLGGVADPDALDRLIRIHREAADPHTRRDALMTLLSQTNPGRALPYLRGIAISGSSEEGAAAVLQLDEFAFRSPTATGTDRARAEAILRELNDGSDVASGLALASICDVARSHAWRLKSNCPRA